jgi:hypothetical protein
MSWADEFEYLGPRVKAVAFRIGYDWHVQVEGYPENHFDSYLSDPGPIPNDNLDLWIRCRPWFDVRKEGDISFDATREGE